MFAATDRRVLSSQMARALARMSPEHGVSPAPPAAGCSPAWIGAAGKSTGATVQCRGSDKSLGALRASVTTKADAGSNSYFSLSGACTLLRSTGYGIHPFCRAMLSGVRVCTWNIQLGLRLEAVIDAVRSCADFRDLDLLCLQEASVHVGVP